MGRVRQVQKRMSKSKFKNNAQEKSLDEVPGK